jgi:hypothetical protein
MMDERRRPKHMADFAIAGCEIASSHLAAGCLIEWSTTSSYRYGKHNIANVVVLGEQDGCATMPINL